MRRSWDHDDLHRCFTGLLNGKTLEEAVAEQCLFWQDYHTVVVDQIAPKVCFLPNSCGNEIVLESCPIFYHGIRHYSIYNSCRPQTRQYAFVARTPDLLRPPSVCIQKAWRSSSVNGRRSMMHAVLTHCCRSGEGLPWNWAPVFRERPFLQKVRPVL